MGSVFQRGRGDTWLGSFKLWDATAGKWQWVQKPTGVRDRNSALAIVAQWERAAGQAKAGTLTRAKALAVVNDILRMAGLETVEAAPTLAKFVNTVRDGKKVAPGTMKKLVGFGRSLTTWAGDKMNNTLDTWTAVDVSAYYAHCRSEFSDTTANHHLRWLSGIFGRAVALGHRLDNPCEAVQLVSNDSQDKESISRAEHAALLRHLRRIGRTDWTALVSLGWHTGHRIQDVLDLTRDSISHDRRNGPLVTLKPAKKQGQGKESRGREIVLPVPAWLAQRVQRVGDFQTINRANNSNGRVSEWFIAFLRAAGVDTKPVQMKKRTVNLKSFHSYRHAMSSRLAAAGVSGELARLVTDHDSPQVQRGYVHSEVSALATALRQARQLRG